MEPKHTAGPWKQKRDCVYVLPEGYPRLLVEVRDIDIAPDSMRTHELPAHFLAIREANARLIAAAPDILAALIACRDRLDVLQDAEESTEADNEALELACAAIRRATV